MDLLDKPSPEAACKVVFNWFAPILTGRQKFSYNVSDPQLIDLDCVIMAVNLTVNRTNNNIFQLDPEYAIALDSHVSRKVV